MTRISIPLNATAMAAWLAAPPVAVLTVTPGAAALAASPAASAGDGYATPPLIPKGGFAEQGLAAAQAALAGLVGARFKPASAVSTGSQAQCVGLDYGLLLANGGALCLETGAEWCARARARTRTSLAGRDLCAALR